LSGVQISTFSTRASAVRQRAALSQRVVGLQVVIGHTATPIAASPSSSGWNWASSAGLDALAGLVAGPQLVAEGLDDVVGGHADVRGAALQQLQHAVQHAGDRAERAVLVLGEAAQPVEVPEQLVGAVDEVDDHVATIPDQAAGSST
jgi:hypothetical protein